MDFDVAFAREIFPVIFKGSIVSMEAAILGCIGSTILGIVLVVLQSRGSFLSLPCRVIIDVIRSSPFLVQLYFLFFVLPVYGVTLPAIAVAVIALVIHYGCYLSEVFRAGTNAVSAGQREAGTALGLRPWQANLLIVTPQVIKMVARPTASYFISLFKTTPYLAVVGIPDLLGSAFDQASATFRYVEPLTIAALLFLLYCGLIAYAGDKIASRLEMAPKG